MFAHQIVEFEGPEAIRWVEVPEPARDDLVLVDVAAAGVSFADLLQTRGEYQLQPPRPYSPGMDAVGVVRWAPPGAGVAAGDRVAVLLRYGCWQEVVAAPEHNVLRLPDDLDVPVGTALALNPLTALFALVQRANVRTGETLLIHGAAGGVGTAAIQIGNALGLRTIAVTSDETKRSFALAAGAHHAVLADGWLDAVRALVGPRAVDVVFDPVGGDQLVVDSIRTLAPDGRVVVVGFASGQIPSVKLNRLLLANAGVVGAASLEYFEQRPEALGATWMHLMELQRAGRLAEPPTQRFPFDDAQGALHAVAGRTARGKVVLSAAR